MSAPKVGLNTEHLWRIFREAAAELRNAAKADEKANTHLCKDTEAGGTLFNKLTQLVSGLSRLPGQCYAVRLHKGGEISFTAKDAGVIYARVIAGKDKTLKESGNACKNAKPSEKDCQPELFHGQNDLDAIKELVFPKAD